jgi:hypothetical protein
VRSAVENSSLSKLIAEAIIIPRPHRILRSGGIPQNPEHLELVRSLPCILAADPQHECSGRIEAAHVGQRGRWQKCPDEESLPMCCRAHRTGRYSFHKGEKTFWSYWIIPTKEYLIDQHVKLGLLHGTIREDSLWMQRYRAAAPSGA